MSEATMQGVPYLKLITDSVATHTRSVSSAARGSASNCDKRVSDTLSLETLSRLFRVHTTETRDATRRDTTHGGLDANFFFVFPSCGASVL